MQHKVQFKRVGHELHRILVDGETAGYADTCYTAVDSKGARIARNDMFVQAFNAEELLKLKAEGFTMRPPRIKLLQCSEAMTHHIKRAVGMRDEQLLFGFAAPDYEVIRPTKGKLKRGR